MCTLLQISDPHFGTEQAAVVEALMQLNDAVRPDVVVLSGDITQRARRSQFAAARQFVDRLSAPQLLTVPGNHDIPLFNVIARCFYPYANYIREFGANLEPELDTESALIICVNTTRAKRHKDGEVSSEQIDRVSRRLLHATTKQVRIVVTHQPVHVVNKHDIDNLLHGYEAAVRAWNHAGADLIIGGHIHLPHVRPIAERFTDLARRTWSVQAGTSVSHRVRGKIPNSVNIIYARFPMTVVERWDCETHANRFQLKERYSLELDR